MKLKIINIFYEQRALVLKSKARSQFPHMARSFTTNPAPSGAPELEIEIDNSESIKENNNFNSLNGMTTSLLRKRRDILSGKKLTKLPPQDLVTELKVTPHRILF